MLPQTHFLFAFLLGIVGFKLGYLSLAEAIIAGVIGVITDLDHLFTFLIVHHEFDVKKAWNAAVIHHEHERTFIHRWPGFIFITLILIVLGNYFLNVGLIIAIGYYSHYLLDHIHVKLKKKFVIREYGFVIKLFYVDLALQLICLVLIILLFLFNF